MPRGDGVDRASDRSSATADASGRGVDTFDPGDADYDSLPDHGGSGELDDGDPDYDSLPDHGSDHQPDDPELSYDDLPDYAQPPTQPQERDEGEPVDVAGQGRVADAEADRGRPEATVDPDAGLHDASHAAEAGRPATGDADNGGPLAIPETVAGWDAEANARAAVEAARGHSEGDGIPLSDRSQFDAAAEAWASDLSHEPTGKQVEFRGPEPAKQVEFTGPQAAKEMEFTPPPGSGSADGTDAAPRVRDSPDGPSDRTERDPTEQRVVDDAKAHLLARREGGDVLGGDPVNRADLWHQQGQNDFGYRQDCALASTSAVLRDCGVDASESEIVHQAVARCLCDSSNPDPADNGGVRDGEAINTLLTSNGVESHIEHPQSPEELVSHVEQGRGVITAINADEPWGASTDSSPAYYDADGRSYVNHAVQVTGTLRDASGELRGVVINDTGDPVGAATVVPVETWDACWTNTNSDHETVVTEHPTAVERSRR